jgi:hypothetical protein
MIDTSLFPYENFPFRLSYNDKKNTTICWFECQQHLDSYINRSKLNIKDFIIDYKNGKPPKSSKKNKDDLQQGTRKTSGRSASGNKGSTKKLDSTGTTSRTRKPKSK